MKYRVTPTLQLKAAADLVQGLLLAPNNLKCEWTVAGLRTALTDVGINWTEEDVSLVGQELLARGVIEGVL